MLAFVGALAALVAWAGLLFAAVSRRLGFAFYLLSLALYLGLTCVGQQT